MGRITEQQLNKLRPVILTASQWEALKNCGLPWHQLSIALDKNIIPAEIVKQYVKATRGFDHQTFILLGNVGVGKTVLGIRYLIRSLSEGYCPPLFLSDQKFRAVYDGRLAIELTWHDVLGYITEVKHPYAIEKGSYVPFESIGERYGVIMVDDFKAKDIEAIAELIEQVYATNSRLILTSNEPPDTLHQKLPEHVKSRIREVGYVLRIKGEDLRKPKEVRNE
jgi:DNA replication protein DnaC